jgi:hypothetical protein
MKCPNCAYENEEGALACNLCQAVLQRETPKAAPAPAPDAQAARAAGEPASLDSGQAINQLLLLALQAGPSRMNEAERLMRRLYEEVGVIDCAEILVATCDAALKASSQAPAEKEVVRAVVAAASKALAQGRLADSARALQPLLPKLAETTAEAFRFQLIALGLRSAAKAPAGDPGEPRALHTPAGLNQLFVHAISVAGNKDIAALDRLMGRLYFELGAEFTADLLAGLGTAWLGSGAYGTKGVALAAEVGQAVAAVRRSAPGEAFAILKKVCAEQKAEGDVGLRFGLVVIALKEPMRGSKPAAAPAAGPAVPFDEEIFKKLVEDGIAEVQAGRFPNGIASLELALAMLPPSDTQRRMKLQAIINGFSANAKKAAQAAPAPAPASAPAQPAGAAPAPIELNVDFGELIKPVKPPQ